MIRRLRRAPPRRPIYSGTNGVIARAVDSVVGLVLPGVAHRMRMARVKSAALLSYEAARWDRVNPRKAARSADQEIIADLEALRASSRDSMMNTADGEAILKTYEDNVVGSGIRPQPNPRADRLGVDESVVEEWREECEAEFERWSAICDATGRDDFWALQKLVARTRKVDGECLATALVVDGEIVVELIDVDRLGWQTPDTDTIRGGVELDDRGRAIRYHVADRHPSDLYVGATKVEQIEAVDADGRLSMVQHVFTRLRPGQTRGVPDMAPALLTQKNLAGYLEAELIGARAAASYAVFIRREADPSDPEINPIGATDDGSGSAVFHQTIDPGTIAYLNDGEEPVAYSPNRPGNQFEPFVVRMTRSTAASQGMAYELVAKDFGSMNYSSARAMLLEVRRTFDGDRLRIVRQFCVPWYRNVILTAIAQGRIDAPPGFLDNIDEWLRCRWFAPAYGWVDPTKEIEASAAAVEANLSNPYDEAARSGADAEAILISRARFLRRAAEIETEYGLEPGRLSGRSSSPPNGQNPRHGQGAGGGEEPSDPKDPEDPEADPNDDDPNDDEGEAAKDE